MTAAYGVTLLEDWWEGLTPRQRRYSDAYSRFWRLRARRRRQKMDSSTKRTVERAARVLSVSPAAIRQAVREGKTTFAAVWEHFR